MSPDDGVLCEEGSQCGSRGGNEEGDGDLSFNWLPANGSAALPGVLRLGNGRVEGAETLKAFLELGRETPVSLCLREEDSVAAVVRLDIIVRTLYHKVPVFWLLRT